MHSYSIRFLPFVIFASFYLCDPSVVGWAFDSPNLVCSGKNCFEKKVDVAGVNLPLRGAGTKTFMLMKIFDAALYVSPDIPSGDVLGPSAKKLVIRYRRSISREQLIETAESHLKKHSPVDYAQIQSRAAQLHAVYKDVHAGDEYSLVFIPGRGTELLFNGHPEIMIPGDDFSAAYFSIWLSDHIFCKRLRNKLLNL